MQILLNLKKEVHILLQFNSIQGKITIYLNGYIKLQLISNKYRSSFQKDNSNNRNTLIV